MRVLFGRKQLLAAVELVKRATARRDVRPILKCVKIVADGERNRVELHTTDLEFGVRHEMTTCSVHTAGAVCVNAADLAKMLKGMKDDDVILRTDNDTLVVGGAACEMGMPALSADDFPAIPAWTATDYHEIEAGALAEAVARVSFAAAKESTKFAMTGTRMEWNGKLVAVATDSKRLAYTEAACRKVGGPKDSEVLVPTKAAEMIREVCEGRPAAELCRVAVGWKTRTETPANTKYPPEVKTEPCEMIVQTDFTTVYSRMIEGRYPPYREIFPKKFCHSVQFDAAAMLAGVKQAATAVDHDVSDKLTFAFSGGSEPYGTCTMSAKGESMASVPARCQDGPITINFDPRYVMDMLKRRGKHEQVTVDMVDPSRPATFRGDGAFRYLVMPLS